MNQFKEDKRTVEKSPYFYHFNWNPWQKKAQKQMQEITEKYYDIGSIFKIRKDYFRLLYYTYDIVSVYVYI